MDCSGSVERTRAVRRSQRDDDGVPRWDYISSGERLTGALERRLATAAQQGDTRARERMVRANIPLVVSVARQFSNPHLETEDLIQEGMIGLLTAIDRFDSARGFRFSTYATYWIRQRVLRAIDRHGRLIRLPVDVSYAARKAVAAREAFLEETGREPGVADLAPACGVSEKRLKAVLECYEEPLSFDALSNNGCDSFTLDVEDPQAGDPGAQLIESEQSQALNSLLETLPARDRMVLESRFGLNGCTTPLADLAERLCMTREGVRQIQRRALLKLRRRCDGVRMSR